MTEENTRELAQLKDLYHYIEFNSAHGIYRSEFFTLAAQSLKGTIGEPRSIRHAKALANVLDTMNLVVQPYEILGGTIAGIYPKIENIPSYEESKAEGRGVIEKYIEAKKASPINTRQSMFARIHYHGRIPYTDLQRMIQELETESKTSEEISHADPSP